MEKVIAATGQPQGASRVFWLCLRSQITQATGDYGAEAIALCEKWLSQDRDNRPIQRNFLMTTGMLAEALTERSQKGDADQALGLLERVHRFNAEVIRASPAAEASDEELAISHDNLGDFPANRGQPSDAAAAGQYLQLAHEIRLALRAAAPASCEAARDLAVSHNLMGDFLDNRDLPGDADAAQGHFLRSLEILQPRWSENSKDMVAFRDIAASRERLGKLLAKRGRPADAEAAWTHCERALKTLEALRQVNSGNAQAARELLMRLGSMPHLLAKQRGRLAEAVSQQMRAMDVAHARSRQKPP